MAYHLGLLGYTELIDKSADDNIYIVSEVELNQYNTPFVTLYHVNDGENIFIKANKRNYEDHPCKSGDIIKTAFRTQNKRVKDNNDKWVESEEQEEILKDYTILKSID